ncbi:unnamed protein product [Prorocentrum cordatum]|nr:unnamed protein product [Polarella glacialis]
MRARGGGAPPTKGCISGGLLEPVAGPSTPLPPTPGAAAAELPISSRHLIRTPPGLELAAPPSPARSPLRLSEHLPVKARHSPDAWAQQTPTCTDSTCTPGGADEGDAVAWPRPAALQLNPGSALHGTGACRPCSWFWTAVGCQNRAGCLYCHACPEGASTTYKRQNKLLAARSRRLARELEAAAPRARPPAGARAESEGRGAAAPRARQLSKHLSTTDGSGSDRGSGPEQEGPAAAGAAASPLEDTDWRVSIAALQALCAAAEMGDSRVLGAVVSCLEHVREDVWRATAEALAPADEGSGPVASRPEASAAPAPAPALLAETAAPAAVRLELMPVLEPSRDLPNAGSAPHGTGACRPPGGARSWGCAPVRPAGGRASPHRTSRLPLFLGYCVGVCTISPDFVWASVVLPSVCLDLRRSACSSDSTFLAQSPQEESAASEESDDDDSPKLTAPEPDSPSPVNGGSSVSGRRHRETEPPEERAGSRFARRGLGRGVAEISARRISPGAMGEGRLNLDLNTCRGLGLFSLARAQDSLALRTVHPARGPGRMMPAEAVEEVLVAAGAPGGGAADALLEAFSLRVSFCQVTDRALAGLAGALRAAGRLRSFALRVEACRRRAAEGVCALVAALPVGLDDVELNVQGCTEVARAFRLAPAAAAAATTLQEGGLHRAASTATYPDSAAVQHSGTASSFILDVDLDTFATEILGCRELRRLLGFEEPDWELLFECFCKKNLDADDVTRSACDAQETKGWWQMAQGGVPLAAMKLLCATPVHHSTDSEVEAAVALLLDWVMDLSSSGTLPGAVTDSNDPPASIVKLGKGDWATVSTFSGHTHLVRSSGRSELVPEASDTWRMGSVTFGEIEQEMRSDQRTRPEDLAGPPRAKVNAAEMRSPDEDEKDNEVEMEASARAHGVAEAMTGPQSAAGALGARAPGLGGGRQAPLVLWRSAAAGRGAGLARGPRGHEAASSAVLSDPELAPRPPPPPKLAGEASGAAGAGLAGFLGAQMRGRPPIAEPAAAEWAAGGAGSAAAPALGSTCTSATPALSTSRAGAVPRLQGAGAQRAAAAMPLSVSGLYARDAAAAAATVARAASPEPPLFSDGPDWLAPPPLPPVPDEVHNRLAALEGKIEQDAERHSEAERQIWELRVALSQAEAQASRRDSEWRGLLGELEVGEAAALAHATEGLRGEVDRRDCLLGELKASEAAALRRATEGLRAELDEAGAAHLETHGALHADRRRLAEALSGSAELKGSLQRAQREVVEERHELAEVMMQCRQLRFNQGLSEARIEELTGASGAHQAEAQKSRRERLEEEGRTGALTHFYEEKLRTVSDMLRQEQLRVAALEDAMRHRNSEARACGQDNLSLESRLSASSEKILSQENWIRRQAEALREAEEEHRQAARAEQDRAALEQRLREAEEKVIRLEAEARQGNDCARMAEQERSVLERRLRDTESQLASLQERLARCEEERREAEDKMLCLEAEARRGIDSTRLAEQERAALELRLRDAEGNATRLEAEARQCVDRAVFAEQQRASLEQRLRDAEGGVLRLEAEAREGVDRSKLAEQQRASLEQRLREAEEKVIRLEAEARQGNDCARMAEQERSVLERRLRDTESQLAAAKCRLDLVEEERHQAEERSLAVDDRSRCLQEQLDDSEEELKRLRARAGAAAEAAGAEAQAAERGRSVLEQQAQLQAHRLQLERERLEELRCQASAERKVRDLKSQGESSEPARVPLEPAAIAEGAAGGRRWSGARPGSAEGEPAPAAWRAEPVAEPPRAALHWPPPASPASTARPASAGAGLHAAVRPRSGRPPSSMSTMVDLTEDGVVGIRPWGQAGARPPCALVRRSLVSLASALWPPLSPGDVFGGKAKEARSPCALGRLSLGLLALALGPPPLPQGCLRLRGPGGGPRTSLRCVWVAKAAPGVEEQAASARMACLGAGPP